MKKHIIVLIIFLQLIISSVDLEAGLLYQNVSDIEKAFDKIEDGLSSGNINSFSNLISSQCYLSLSNGTFGYYSYNQTYYILQGFLKINRPISFRFTSVVSSKNPYATGVLTYEYKNRRVTAQVFISVESKGTNWYISQITIK